MYVWLTFGRADDLAGEAWIKVERRNCLLLLLKASLPYLKPVLMFDLWAYS